ncbi:cilia- and flagella-associated protein 251-like [Arachis ipaensis]|uniref:cilia- and flagella-associated protein 251-like n=1 Tax=Arachis ipaensis TaxID=130454 RepID=UPI0007AEEA37|nr:cilia- and flagella-associated protein 251-like [Arachis ipaensis]
METAAITQEATGKNEQEKAKENEATINQESDKYDPCIIMQRQKRIRKEINKEEAGASHTKEKESKKNNKPRYSVLEIEEPDESGIENEEEREPKSNKKVVQEEKEQNQRGTNSANTSRKNQNKTKKVIYKGESSQNNKENNIAKYKESWNVTNDDTQNLNFQTTNNKEQEYHKMEEEEPPDPRELEQRSDVPTETDMKKEIKDLIMGVECETPKISEIGKTQLWICS